MSIPRLHGNFEVQVCRYVSIYKIYIGTMCEQWTWSRRSQATARRRLRSWVCSGEGKFNNNIDKLEHVEYVEYVCGTLESFRPSLCMYICRLASIHYTMRRFVSDVYTIRSLYSGFRDVTTARLGGHVQF